MERVAAKPQEPANMLAPMFGDQRIRIVQAPHGPQWVTVDVCKALGLRNPSAALARLDADRRGLVDARTGEPLEIVDGRPVLSVVNEPGLYDLILRCRKPAARAFQRWITGEVLPSLARSGSYSLAANERPAVDVAALVRDPEGLARVAAELASLAAELGRERVDLALVAPAVRFADRVQRAAGEIGIREAAKILAVCERDLVDLMLDRGLCYRGHRGRLTATATTLERGLAVERLQTITTPKGDRVIGRMLLTVRGLELLAAITIPTTSATSCKPTR